jgi:hypothetical protein
MYTECAPSRPPWMGLWQAEICLSDDPLEAHDVCFQNASTKSG